MLLKSPARMVFDVGMCRKNLVDCVFLVNGSFAEYSSASVIEGSVVERVPIKNLPFAE